VAEQLVRAMEIHLLYASIVWVAAWLLTSLPRGSATQKYWMWVATSINFLLPLSAVPDRFWPPRAAWFTSNVAALDDRIALPATAIAIVWSIGAAIMAARLLVRIAAGRRGDGAATSFLRDGVPVRFAASQRVPAVDGILRPRIALPAGLERVLTADEFDAVLLHELRHAKRRDNLIRLLHEAALCLFWFHPLVWMTGARLALYRELSCDESVLHGADGRDLVSALAKLAAPDEALLLQASASSFLTARLARLTAPDRRPASAMLAMAFGAILLCGAAGPVARSAAIAACARTHGVVGGVKGGLKGGLRGGVQGGVAGGVVGGVKGGLRGGVQGGVAGGIAGGIKGGVRGGVRGGIAGGVADGVRGGLRGGIE